MNKQIFGAVLLAGSLGLLGACSSSKGAGGVGDGGPSENSDVDAGQSYDGSIADSSQEGSSIPDSSQAESGSAASMSTMMDLPSCRAGGGGLTNCGLGGIGTESCCTSLEVPGGTFYRTYDVTDAGAPTAAPDGGPVALADPAVISGFRLDKYEVTVGRFRQFVSAVLPADGGAGWTPPAGSGKHTHLNGGNGLVNSADDDAGVVYETGWLVADNANLAPTDVNLTTGCNVAANATWTPTPIGDERMPIDCVNWWEAYAFCIWDDGFLPSEAEWEYAAAGGDEQRLYPWGATDPGSSNAYAVIGTRLPVGSASLGAGRWGQFDLAGNMWQWTLDWLAPYVDPCADCAYLSQNTYRTLRGGSGFVNSASYLFPAIRNASPPANRATIGFRCARTP